MGVAVWRSGTLSRWAAALLALACLIGLAAFLDVVQIIANANAPNQLGRAVSAVN